MDEMSDGRIDRIWIKVLAAMPLPYTEKEIWSVFARAILSEGTASLMAENERLRDDKLVLTGQLLQSRKNVDSLCRWGLLDTADLREALSTPAAADGEPVAEVIRDGATVRLQWASIKAAHNAKPGHLFAAAPSAVAGLPLAQEPKYTVNGSAIVNRASGEAIPSDEPVFIFRARDQKALRALSVYASSVARGPKEHWGAVMDRIEDFVRFNSEHPERMKEPDTAPGATSGGQEGSGA